IIELDSAYDVFTCFFFSSRRRHTRFSRDWSSDVCSSDLIAASLFAGGAATLLQTLGLPFFGCQLPLVQGVSFAGVATMIAIIGNDGSGGLPVVFGAVIAASLIGLLITPVFSRITKFFPPLVTGIVITTIGLTLMPVAARWAMGGNSQASDL